MSCVGVLGEDRQGSGYDIGLPPAFCTQSAGTGDSGGRSSSTPSSQLSLSPADSGDGIVPRDDTVHSIASQSKRQHHIITVRLRGASYDHRPGGAGDGPGSLTSKAHIDVLIRQTTDTVGNTNTPTCISRVPASSAHSSASLERWEIATDSQVIRRGSNLKDPTHTKEEAQLHSRLEEVRFEW
jgi:hypothetical protein